MAQLSSGAQRYDGLANAVLRNPLDVPATVRAAAAAIDSRREADAIPLLEYALSHGSRDPNVPHMLGLLHRALGDLTLAIEWLDRALTIAPAAPLTVHARAIATREAGLPSLAWFDRARALTPNDGGVLLGHAAAMAADESATAADSLLDELLIQHPGWIEGQSALIRLRFAERRDDTYAAIDRALAEAPRDPQLHHLKIISMMRAGRPDTSDAIAAARAALGDTPAMLADMAIVATEQQQLRDADVAFARLDPLATPDLALNWMRHLLRRSEPERVAALFGHVKGTILDVAWPYLSLAWRLTGDARAAWLDREAFVHIAELELDTSILSDLAALLPSLHRSRGQPLDQSVRGGTQTDGPLLSRIDPPLRTLRAALAAEVTRYIKALPPPEPGHPLLGKIPASPRFAGSWSVQLTGGGFHEPHIHGSGWVSSALYITLPAATATATEGWLSLGEPQTSLGLASMPGRLVEPRAGRLVLFPSTLWHGTRPFTCGGRLSIAFDVS